jgi:hypothetical protein
MKSVDDYGLIRCWQTELGLSQTHLLAHEQDYLGKIAKVHCQGGPVSWWRQESILVGHFGAFLAHESPIGEHEKMPEKENAAKSLMAGLADLAAVGS